MFVAGPAALMRPFCSVETGPEIHVAPGAPYKNPITAANTNANSSPRGLYRNSAQNPYRWATTLCMTSWSPTPVPTASREAGFKLAHVLGSPNLLLENVKTIPVSDAGKPAVIGGRVSRLHRRGRDCGPGKR